MGLDVRQGSEVRTYSILDQCFRIALVAAAITMPANTLLCNIFLITSFVLSIVVSVRKKVFTPGIALLPLIIFFLTLISILYSENLKASFAWFELGSNLLLIPLIFGLGATVIDEKLRYKLLILFGGACIAVCVFGYLKIAIRSGVILPLSTATSYSYEDPFSRIAFEEVTHIHPSYLSVYLIFSLVIVFDVLKARPLIKGLLTIIIFIFLVIMSSKNQLALFFIVISLLLWEHIKASGKIKAIILAGVIAVAFIGGYFNGQVRHRFIDELSKTLGDRIILWETGIEIISDNPVLGVGVGDTDDEMNKLLVAKGNSHLINFNMHNQYLDYWLMLGIAGLISLLVILFVPIFRKVDTPFMFLILIMGLSMLTESMMYRHKGLVFFLFFYGLFGANYLIRFKKVQSIQSDLSNADTESAY